MSVGEKSVVFLLGAGCSYDASVPISNDMIVKLEKLLSTSYKDDLYPLYKYVRYTMEYGSKLSEQNQDFNIESLLVTLHALAEHKKTHLYPFVNGYTNDLIELAGPQFKNIKSLINLIQKELPGWVTLTTYRNASYYKNFETFQKSLNFALRIFSLNYDLCLENNVDCKVETGFSDDHPWDGNRFMRAEDDEETAIYLYKLHGSINWERSNDQLRISQQQGITPDVIFGTDIKMQAIDPYLFYLYEFRKYVLAAEIIITIGYSFNDTHINDLIRQAMEYNKEKKLISVSPVTDVSDEMNRINCRLELHENNDRIIIENKKAKDFLDNTLSVEYIGNKLPEPDLPF